MEIYQKTRQFTLTHLDRIRDSRLIGHMNDSARSLPSNIREGAKRRNTKAYLEFLGFGRASLEELKGDYEELKRELGKGLRWSDKDREGKIRIKNDIEELLNLIYGEDCMLGRQIRSIENKAFKEKDLPQGALIKKAWKASEEREKKFWDFVRDKGLEKDGNGRFIRINKDKKG